MPWQINTEADKQLVENLIKDKKTNLFKTKYRAIVFKVIESANKKINPKRTLSYDQKSELLDAFMEHLMADDAKRLKAYLHPKRLSIQKDTENKKSYTLVSSQEVVGDLPKYDKDGFPLLKFWVFEQSDFFIRAKFIVDGIASLDINVIKKFLLSYSKPGCLSMISKWIFDNQVYSGEPQFYDEFVLRVAKDFASDLYQNESLRKEFLNYRYGREFYSYFKAYILTPYLNKQFFKKISNPNIPRKKKDHDPATDIVLNEEIEQLYPEADKKDATRLSDRKKMEKTELLDKISMEKEIQENHLFSNLDASVERHDETFFKVPENVSTFMDYREKVDLIFKEMSRSSSGRKQVEILKLIFLQPYEVEGFIPTDQALAKVLDIKIGNFRSRKNRAIETAKEIAETLGLKL